MPKPVEGYAVIDKKGAILVNTVSSTQRAAKVNWIVIQGLFVPDRWSDEQINHAFAYMSVRAGVTLAAVTISTTEN